MSGPAQPFTMDDETTALWHMDEGQGELIKDAGGVFDGTLLNVEFVEFGATVD